MNRSHTAAGDAPREAALRRTRGSVRPRCQVLMAAGRRGKRSQKVVRRPGSLSTPHSPP